MTAGGAYTAAHGKVESSASTLLLQDNTQMLTACSIMMDCAMSSPTKMGKHYKSNAII